MAVAPRRNRVTARGLEPPWAVLGVSVEHARDVADAVRISGLGWQVVAAHPVFVFSGSHPLVVPGQAVTVRQDPEPRVLATVTDSYEVMQNRDAFAIVDGLARERNLRFGWAGEYDGGRKVFLTLSEPEPIVVGSDDVHDVHYMVLNSHDRSTAVRLEMVLNRRRHNTRPDLAFPNVDRQIRFKHTLNLRDRAEEAIESVPRFRAYLAKFFAAAEELDKQPFLEATFARYARRVFEQLPNAEAAAAGAAGLFSEERKTRWGAYCAVVRWLDQFEGVRGRVGVADEQRAIKALAGVHSDLKQSAGRALMTS